MKTIVLATDGSPSAAQATASAIEIALATGAPLHVVTAWSIPASAFGYEPMLVPDLADAEREHARHAAERAREQAAAAGVSVTDEVRQGLAVDEICAAAREADASVLVVGAHGWGALKRFVNGSVSTGVLHGAPCPVLVVRGEAGAGEAVRQGAGRVAA